MKKQTLHMIPRKKYRDDRLKTLIIFWFFAGIFLLMACPGFAAETVLYGLAAEDATAWDGTVLEGSVNIVDLDKSQDGSVYVVGNFTGKLTFGPDLVFSSTKLNVPVGFLGKFNPAGVWETVVTFKKVPPKKVLVKDTSVYICDDDYVQKYDTQSLNLESGATMSGSLTTADLSVDGNGNVYVCGRMDLGAGEWGSLSVSNDDIHGMGYIAKLDSEFSWEWVIQSRTEYDNSDTGETWSKGSSDFRGITVDVLNRVNIIGNVTIYVADRYEYIELKKYHLNDSGTQVYDIIKQVPAMGQFTGRRSFFLKLGAPADASFYQTSRISTAKVLGQDILFANDQLYVLESQSDTTDRRMSTLTLDGGSKELKATISSPDPLQSVYMTVGEGNIYTTGKFSSTLKFKDAFENEVSSESSPNNNIFIAKQDQNLVWSWTKKLACGYDTSNCAVEPDEFGVPVIAAGGGVNFVAGSFNSGTMVVGNEDEAPNAELSAGSQNAGYMTPLDNDGKFARRYSFTFNSPISQDQIKVEIDGQEYPMDSGSEMLIAKGAHIKITAPGVIYYQKNGQQTDYLPMAVTKIFCTGYNSEGIPSYNVGGNISENPVICDFNITADTDVSFLWESTYHALEIKQDFGDTGLNYLLSGDPDPTHGTHWYVEGDTVTPAIDGHKDGSTPGIRYNVLGYTIDGGAIVPFASYEERHQLDPITMNNPVKITYRWQKDCRLQVSASTPRAANLPIIEVYNADGTVNTEQSRQGSGEFWFHYGSFLNVRSQESNAYEFTGYTNGTGSVVPVQKVFEEGASRAYQFTITNESTLTLQYGQTSLKMEAVIGNPVYYNGSDEPYASQLNWNIKPTVTVVEAPPGSTADDMVIWDDVGNKIYPLRPGKVILEWTCSGVDCPDGTSTTQIESRFPDTAHYPHVAQTPAVALDSDPTDTVAFKELKYTTCDASVSQGGGFTSPRPGRSVLLFSQSPNPDRAANGDLTQETLRVRVVKTKMWNDGILTGTADIGTPIVSPYHASALLSAGRNGYVFWENARYNPLIYNREQCAGPIIPVNRQFTADSEDDLVVIWYSLKNAIAWPETSVRYNCVWPAISNRIVIASRLGTEGKNTAGADQLKFEPPRYNQVEVYNQPDPDSPGYNPNEEHALVKDAYMNEGAQRSAVFALRNDLNITTENENYTSHPFVLVQYYDTQAAAFKMAVYGVQTQDSAAGYQFQYTMTAGRMIQAPYPLNEVIGLAVPEEITGVDGQPQVKKCYWEDKNGQPWAISGETYVKMYFHYPLQPGFWYNRDRDGDGSPEGPGQVVPWLPQGGPDATPLIPTEVRYTTQWPEDVPVLKAGETLTFSGGEYKADHPETSGLPGVLGWSSGRVVFDGWNPLENTGRTFDDYSVRLIAPLTEKTAALDVSDIPEDFRPETNGAEVVGTRWYFKALHAGLKNRIFYDTLTQQLGIRGFVNGKILGDEDLYAAPPAVYCLQPNILTKDELATLQGMDGANDPWRNAAAVLYAICRDPQGLDRNSGDGAVEYTLGLDPVLDNDGNRVAGQAVAKHQLGPGLALTGNPNLLDPAKGFTQGYVTLAQNDHEDVSGPVSLNIIKVVNDKYRGAIDVVLTDNVFDEKAALRHTGDFGGNPDDLVFEWYYREDDGTRPEPPDVAPTEWQKFGEPAAGRMEISIAGAGKATLVDNLFYVRYYHKNAAGEFSDWAGDAASNPATGFSPQLLMGWVKRVRDAINPYEARIKDFRNENAPATYASMVQQAGPRYEGPVALNPDKNVIENLGLIELYQTVMERAMSLSIDRADPAASPGVRSTLLLSASMIADLYMLLGNEAFTDAQDPTIGFGTDSTEYGSLAPTIFTFQNQLPDLLSEELALLRGVEKTGARPAYNRLIWNFTKGQGEAAYALSYNITDANKDGFINEADGRILYPQGHGDAWGHYLTALKTYYKLLRHPYFDWETRSELYNIEGVVIDVDYYDERKFARIASAKARTGAEITDLTYRSRYVEDPEGQWQGYTDTDSDRNWGVAGWARRAGQGAYLDWLTANAVIPATDEDPTHTGLKKIDRTTVAEIQEINAYAADIRKKFENANTGINPLGLAVDVTPFDIDTSLLKRAQGQTHFEQVYTRAVSAAQNALAVFDYANEIGNMLRQTEVSVDNFRQEINAQDNDYKNRLIEIFGSPYEGTIGAGKPYPAGYNGPDYMLYNYVDVTDVSEDAIPPPSETMTAFFKPGNFRVEVPEEGAFDDLAMTYSHFFDEDLSESAMTSSDFSQALAVDYPLSAADYSFQAPEDWGVRKSPGEIQQVLSELVQAKADLMSALAVYSGNMSDIQDAVDLLEAKSNQIAETIELKTAEKDTAISLNSLILAANATGATASLAADFIEDMSDASAEALPTTTGLSNDATAPARSAIKISGATASRALKVVAFASEQAASSMEFAKDINAMITELEVEDEEYKYEIKEQLKAIKALLGNEASNRVEIFKQQEFMRQVSDKYRTTLGKGLRLIEERRRFNAKTAAATQQYRYQDMTFRVSRNDALQKYRASFNLAARYAYLAAKTYDYETNLSPNDPGSSRPLLTAIVKQQSLGKFTDGVPVAGQGGLADILARLAANYSVLKSQMGFNNPQQETGRFSLRTEWRRLAYSEETDDGDELWRRYLSANRVENLWDIPEFRQYCRPFAPQSEGPQPGIVLEFPTSIIFGYNVFGRELQAGDHAYDPTHFTTKIRSVSAWMDNYDGQGLSLTPRVYLIPTGMDVMLVPTSNDLEVREWNVVDQRLPVPLPAGQSDMLNPDYIPVLDSLDGTFWEMRRFSSFRAYHDSGYLAIEQMTTDSRLVGRSVWNTNWMLIIPGGALLFDPDEGLDTLIYGQRIPGAPEEGPPEEIRDLNGVKDIKLFFETYAISGN